MPSVVTTEIKALALRHRLLDRLGERHDILAPDTLSPSLKRHVARFLVAGLDDTREPGTCGWPVPTGGRYAKLCFSPLLDPLPIDAGVANGVIHRLPTTEAEYVDYVARITGIGRDQADDMARIFRFDPGELFHACREMRVGCPFAWTLLLSNEFALAQRAWPALTLLLPQSRFQYPLVDAFMLIAELERANLIMRHLARARAIFDRPQFIEALNPRLPLSVSFKPDQLAEVYRWVEYLCFSTGALTDLLFDRTATDIALLPKGYAPWAFARGDMIGTASDFQNHPELRKVMIKACAKPPLPPKVTNKRQEGAEKAPVERRTVMLRNREIARWYGMTNEVLPILALDDARQRHPTRRVATAPGSIRKASSKIPENSRPVLTRLASAIRMAVDPAMQEVLEGGASRYLAGSSLSTKRDATLERNLKLGLRLGLTYLPPPGKSGAAARLDPAMWNTPLRDADLWRILLDPSRGSTLHRLRHPAQRQIRTLAGVARRAYGPMFTRLQWSDEIARVMCDLAVALSPISANPHIAWAIHALEQKPTMKRLLGYTVRRAGYRNGRK